MARHKITPSERAPHITEAMRRASNKLSPPTAEALFGDQNKTSKGNKTSGKPILPTPRGSQDRATSEPINAKRKVAPANSMTSPQPASTNGDNNDRLSTATPPASIDTESTNGTTMADTSNTRRPAKRQKVTDPTPPTRRSTRVSKQPTDSTPNSTRSSPARQVKKKPAAQNKKSTKPRPRVNSDDNQSDIATTRDDPLLEGMATGTDPNSNGLGNGRSHSPTSALIDPQISSIHSPYSNGFSIPIRDASSISTSADAPQPMPQDMSQSMPQSMDFQPIGFTNVHTGQMVFPTQPLMPWDPNPYLPYEPRPEDCIAAANGTLWVPVDESSVSMMGQMIMQPPNYNHIPRPRHVNGNAQEMAPGSTKGQKVKGRPKPRNASATAPQPIEALPDGIADTPATTSRPVANTYPRKQPFKSQVDFPNYPPASTPIPDEYSLFEICQRLPNCLREQNLTDFIQHDWSANELCACLQDEARAVLNNRAGKDKTMVFQKRLERLRRDLKAKGEFDGLMAAPKMRLDGRPPWVKRGNVRRK